ncbi:MAG: T9SS type A sorting domain-containing protein [Bacteroidales bacterium]|nr:T9SS type A sorting domain-containing protein [Bacteroidales bacterium]
MKKILIPILFLSIGLCAYTQHLYVQPIDGEQIAFALANKPKITFDDRVMSVQQLSFPLSDVRNLSFVQQNTDPTNIIVDTENDHILLFPNPVKDELNLVIQIPVQNLNYRFFDMNGKQLTVEQIHSQTTQINMQNFRAGIYVLHIEQNGQSIQSFRIVKQ